MYVYDMCVPRTPDQVPFLVWPENSLLWRYVFVPVTLRLTPLCVEPALLMWT